MARTVKNVVDRVQITLQDKKGTRYPADQLAGYLIDGLHLARQLRPDMFIGKYDVAIPDAMALADTLPVPDHVFGPLANYVAGCAELRDDEFAVDGRAMTLQEAYKKNLIQGI